MDWKILHVLVKVYDYSNGAFGLNLTKTPYLVLFVLLGTVGVGAASALMTITLSGNVVVTDDLTVDTNTLVVDSTNNRVGIGTTNPTSKLHVVGDLTLQSDIICNGCVSGGAILDGTITNADLPFSIKFKTILDDAAGNAAGWDPDGVAQFFQIDDDDVTQNSYVIVGIGAGGTTFFDSCQTTVLLDTHPNKDFQIMACPVIANGFPMRYMIITP